MKNIPLNYSILENTLNLSAISCIDTMRLIQQNGKINTCLVAYHILASTSLELFAKLKFIKRFQKEEKDIKYILKKFKGLGHELDEIFSSKEIGLQFLSATGIKMVKKEKNNGEYSYDFYLQDDIVIRTYNPESLKYWLLSEKRSNNSVYAFQAKRLLDLCEKVQSATYDAVVS